MVSELRPEDPQAIGPYRLVGQLGQGGMGRVFLGVSPGGRPVAVKAIRAELAADPEFRRRFGQEVASARRVSGVFTAQVVDADVDGPVAWMATAYVPGPSLAEAVDTHGPLPEASLLALAAGLAESLSAIHAAGVVHRDLKPSNVLLAEDGPRVIDFGISRAAESTMLTQAGLVVGSPGFMSPEQATGYQVGPPSDIFNLGAVLAFAAIGEGPFGTGTTAALLYRVVHGTPSLDRVPPAVRPLIERCLAKDPSQRPTASGLLAEVGALQPGGNWLPDSLTRTFAAGTPSRPGFPGPVPASSPGYVPSGSSFAPPGPPRAASGSAASPGGQPSTRDSWPQVAATGAALTATAGSAAPTPPGGLVAPTPPRDAYPPPLPTGGSRPPRRRVRPLVLALVLGGVVGAGGAAAFVVSTMGHSTTHLQDRPAAVTSSAPSSAGASVFGTSASPSVSRSTSAPASTAPYTPPPQSASAPASPTVQPTTFTTPTTSPTSSPTTSPTTTTPTTTPPTTTPTTAPPTSAPPTSAPASSASSAPASSASSASASSASSAPASPSG